MRNGIGDDDAVEIVELLHDPKTWNDVPSLYCR